MKRRINKIQVFYTYPTGRPGRFTRTFENTYRFTNWFVHHFDYVLIHHIVYEE